MTPLCELHRKSESTFDPTDANKAIDLSHATIDLLHHLARALHADDNNMRMGRDGHQELFVRSVKIARILGLLPYNYKGVDVDQFWRDLSDLPPEAQEPGATK